jgi:hypothetical protein
MQHVVVSHAGVGQRFLDTDLASTFAVIEPVGQGLTIAPNVGKLPQLEEPADDASGGDGRRNADLLRGVARRVNDR